MSSYKTCAVPMCRSTTVKYPDKLFIHVPKSLKRRKLWLQLARRDPNLISDKSPIFFCQDHFDLPNDMENYIQYSVMGSVGKIRMKPDCLPSKLECHPDGMTSEVAVTLGATTNSDIESISGNNFKFKDQATQVRPEATNQFVQVCLKAKIRSKAVQCTIPTKDKSTSLTSIMYSETSPFTCGVETATFVNTKVKNKLLFHNENLGESYLQLPRHTSPSSQSLLVMKTNSSNQGTQCEWSEIQRRTAAEHCVQLVKSDTRYCSPGTESDQSTPGKMEGQEHGLRVPPKVNLMSSRSRPRKRRPDVLPMKVTSGPSPNYEVITPLELISPFIITELKSEAGGAPPSREVTISFDKVLEQIDENQPTEDLVPLSAHPVPLSNAPDPLCDFLFKSEEEVTEVGNGTAVGQVWAVKEEDTTVRVEPVQVIVDSEPTRLVQSAVDSLLQTRKQEQKIKNLTRQRDQLRLKVRSMRKLIRQRDANINKLRAQLHALSGFVTQHHGPGVADELAPASCGDADTPQTQNVKPNEPKTKSNRVVFVVKGADRPNTSAIRHKSLQSAPHIRPKSIQSDADILQQSLIGVLDTSEIQQQTLLADKNTSDITQKSVSFSDKSDIRKNQSVVIQSVTDIPKKPSADTKPSLMVVKAKSDNPQIGSKRKSDIQQNPSIVIHSKLDVEQKVASDISQTSVGLQHASDIRQSALVIQIDGMHSTVWPPTLIRLDDNNMDLG